MKGSDTKGCWARREGGDEVREEEGLNSRGKGWKRMLGERKVTGCRRSDPYIGEGNEWREEGGCKVMLEKGRKEDDDSSLKSTSHDVALCTEVKEQVL